MKLGEIKVHSGQVVKKRLELMALGFAPNKSRTVFTKGEKSIRIIIVKKGEED